jgi:hypothetical protein
MKSVPGIPNGATYSASAGDEGRFVLGARVTHGRWFARRFNRFLVVSEDGVVTDQPSPVYGG